MTCNWENKDCCELLSAYLDGEVTAAERQQVEEWLATDARMQQLHRRLLKLHHGWQSLPALENQESPEKMAHAVFAKMEKRSLRKRFVISGGAIAAVLLATVSSLIFSDNSPVPEIAISNQPQTASEPLKIALNRPVVPIPPAAMK
jgi:anti-sigma factor RsiW